VTDIEALDLEPVARHAAELLQARHPEVRFTSGRRNLAGQARAMAQNIVKTGNRQWIAQTYRDSVAIRKLQRWVNAHPNATHVTTITAGLLSVLLAMPPEQAARISYHLAGLAFDVQPIPGDHGEAVKATIRTLPGLGKFLEEEGGAVRWHAQFDAGALPSNSPSA